MHACVLALVHLRSAAVSSLLFLTRESVSPARWVFLIRRWNTLICTARNCQLTVVIAVKQDNADQSVLWVARFAMENANTLFTDISASCVMITKYRAGRRNQFSARTNKPECNRNTIFI